MQKTPSRINSPEKEFQLVDMAKTLQASVYFSLALSLATVIVVFLIPASGWERLQKASWVSLAVSLGLYFLLARGYYRLTAYGMVLGYTGLTVYGAWIGVGIRGAGYSAFTIIVLLAAVFLNRRAGYIVAFAATLFGLGLIGANQMGWLANQEQPMPELAVWANVSLYFFIAAILLDIVLRHIDRALQRQACAEDELRRLNADLEQRIEERTAQLVESETHYRLMAENASDVIWTMDLNLRLTYLSPSAERARGYTVQEIMAQPLAETLTPASYEYAMQVLAEEMPNAHLHPTPNYFRILELEYLHKDGGTYWSEVKVSFLRDEQGQLKGLLGVGRNIDQRKQAETALRESEERYRLVSAISSDYVFSNHVNPDGHRTTDWVAGAFELITGYTVEEFQMHGGWPALLHPDDLERDNMALAELYANRRVVSEIRILRKNGDIRWVRVYAHPLWDTQHNTLTGIYGAVQDITEQKQAETRAHVRREMLEKVIRLGQAITQHTDLQSCLSQIHHSIKHELGFDRVGLLLYDPTTNQLTDALTPNPVVEMDDSSWYLRAVTEHESWNAVMKTPKGLTIIDEILPPQPTTSDGKTRPIKQHATLAAWAGDKPVALIAVDNALTRSPLTEEKLEALKLFAGYTGLAIENARWNAYLEQRVVQRTAELEAANRELQDFTYTIAHDLRAPARAMIGFSRLLQEEHAKQLDEEGQHYLHRVTFGAQRMGQMIDELLAFTHLGRQTLYKQPVDLLTLVHRVLEEFQPDRAGRQIEITLRNLPDAVADPEMLEHVWRHLLSNAFKFTRHTPPAKIEIGAEKHKGEIVFFVRDNGVGFDPQYAGKLFGVFQRLNLEEAYEGTGMGLAVVQRIIHRHGGRIWAEAKANQGATFYFTLGKTP